MYYVEYGHLYGGIDVDDSRALLTSLGSDIDRLTQLDASRSVSPTLFINAHFSK